MTVRLTNADAIILWPNARDSIEHALEHFACLSGLRNKDSDHDKKWIVLSVHHAAEIFTYMLLKEFDDKNRAFYKNGNHHYPGLERAINALLHISNNFPMTKYEKDILGFFRKLSAMRNKIMHGEMPSNMDVSLAAMAMVGISKISRKRCSESADDIYGQSPSIQRDVVESIRHNMVDEYTGFVENYVSEITGKSWIPQCPSCSGHTILNDECEACFEEISTMTCPHCDEEIYTIDSYPFDQDCSECSKQVIKGTV